MKKPILFLVLGLALTFSSGFSQDFAFKVLANKGSNEVKSGDSWQAIKAFAVLKAGDELRVSANGYLGLMHATGKSVEIKQAGSYKVSDLAANIKSGTSVLNKYADFILSSNSAEAKKNRLSATGAVHRGRPGDIKVSLPDNQYCDIYNNIAIINWESTKGTGPYTVKVKSLFEDELMKIETNETSLQIDMSDPKIASEPSVTIEVTSKADGKSKSEPRTIRKLSVSKREHIQKSLAEISGELKEETPLNKFILAGFYEENKLFIDAITCYEQAIKMAPDVTDYKDAYQEFLLRNKLK